MIAPLSETGVLGANGVLLSAPLIGLAFGWFLERGGLGCAPKLAAQFYLRDLTVFKVMFSALLTAMLGAFWLDHTGLLNLSLVQLPETFVLPQALGGALFGAGFLVAGLCPGTSCVAAAAGRLDGLGVMGGILAGVILFNTGYQRMERFYKSTPMGGVTLPELARLPRGPVIALVTLVALGGFVLAARLERARA
jgi:hypothetical protein